VPAGLYIANGRTNLSTTTAHPPDLDRGAEGAVAGDRTGLLEAHMRGGVLPASPRGGVEGGSAALVSTVQLAASSGTGALHPKRLIG
jgi:hypothetical protein